MNIKIASLFTLLFCLNILVYFFCFSTNNKVASPIKPTQRIQEPSTKNPILCGDSSPEFPASSTKLRDSISKKPRIYFKSNPSVKSNFELDSFQYNTLFDYTKTSLPADHWKYTDDEWNRYLLTGQIAHISVAWERKYENYDSSFFMYEEPYPDALLLSPYR